MNAIICFSGSGLYIAQKSLDMVCICIMCKSVLECKCVVFIFRLAQRSFAWFLGIDNNIINWNDVAAEQ